MLEDAGRLDEAEELGREALALRPGPRMPRGCLVFWGLGLQGLGVEGLGV